MTIPLIILQAVFLGQYNDKESNTHGFAMDDKAFDICFLVFISFMFVYRFVIFSVFV